MNLKVKLTQAEKDLCNEIIKSLSKQIDEDTGRLKDTPQLQIHKRNIVKMSILPKAICRFNKNSHVILHINRYQHSKIYMKTQNSVDNQRILSK